MVNIGDKLKGRYEITHYQGPAGQDQHGKGYVTWVVKDGESGKFRCLRIYDPESSIPAQESLKILTHLADLSKDDPGSQSVLKALDHFWLGSSNRILCTVHEIYGPSMLWLNENGSGPWPWPAPMLRRQCWMALSGLAFLHANGIAQGGFKDSDLLISYPGLDASDESQVSHLFGYPTINSETGERTPNYGLTHLNNTGTAPHTDPDDANFGMIISVSEKAFFLNEPPKVTSKYIDSWLFKAPELVFENSVGVESDLWSLGALMVGICSGYPTYSYFLAGSNRASGQEQMLAARDILGELPDEYLAKFKETYKTLPPVEFGQASLVSAVTPVPEDAEETANMFSEKEYTDLAGLIWKLMAYKPCERISAAEALEDPFFAVGRP